MVGRVDVLQRNPNVRHWKIDGLDLSALLTPARPKHEGVEVTCTQRQDHGLELALDNKLLELVHPTLEYEVPTHVELPIINTNRTVGTILSHELAKRYGETLLPDGTIRFRFHGSAGQSFGAFLARGVTMELEGDANDYVGKGLSGGRLIVYPPRESTFVPEENVIIGNVALYGATSGEAFFRGRAAERFCVRNSGAWAVIEGVGDHGCEYMTGGRVVVLGPTGRNFAAGMSGGIAYIWDPDEQFLPNCNREMVELERIDSPEEADEVCQLIAMHQRYTGSTVAERVLDAWPENVPQFVKVMPRDYRRVLMEMQAAATEAEVPI